MSETRELSADTSFALGGGIAEFSLCDQGCVLSKDLAESLGWSTRQRVDLEDWVHSEDREDLLVALDAIRSRQSTAAKYQCRVRNAQKAFHYVEWSLVAGDQSDGVLGIGLVQTATSAFAPQRLLYEVVESMPDGFVVYDPQDRLLVCNHAFRSVFEEHVEGSVCGMTFAEIAQLCRRIGIYDNVGEDPDEYLKKRIAAHNKGNVVHIQKLKSGRVERIDEIRLDSGFMVAIHADVTQLHREGEAAKQREIAKTDFLSVMSHEIRTPLVGLIGMLDLLAGATTRDERVHIESIMREAGGRLMDIVNNVLDLSKIESGQMILDNVSFSPEQVLMPLFERYRVAAQAKGLEMAFVNPKPLSTCRSDPLRFGQIVENLLSNAVKFTEIGSITLTLSETPKGLVKVVVKDTGIGIARAQLPRLMQPFEQADPSYARKYGGTGMGISIVNNLVDLFGGTLNCSSIPGKGTTFTVLLPLPRVPCKRSRSARKPGTKVKVEKGLRALMADDNDINRQVLSTFLTSLGFDVDQVDSGLSAVEAAHSKAYDVLFLDISMPGLDGVDALRMIREKGPNRKVPALAVTANALKSDIEGFLAAGFKSVLSKPFRKVDLTSALQDAGIGSFVQA